MKNEPEIQERSPSMIEMYYQRITRIAEYYIFLCFIIITIVPLFEYSWVPPFIRFIYFTGFPLLVLLLLVSIVKDALLDMLKNRFENNGEEAKSTGGQ